MSHKFILMGPIIVLAFFLMASAVEVSQANGPVSYASISENPSIVKDDVFIAKENGTQVEWRHIVLKGNNTQIGMGQAEVAQRDYGVKSLKRYADPVYGKARQIYMERNYPIMRERMKGIAMAYGLSPDNVSFDTNTLPYDAGSMACSMIYFPPETIANGHAITSRNLEWYLVPMDLYLNRTENANGNGTFTRNFLLEIHPDQGYSTIAIGTSDLNIVIDGLNSAGLGISLLVDEGMEPVLKMPISGERNSGIMSAQMTRLVLDTCGSVEEAKIAFLANKEYFPIAGIHYMVYDSQGNSAIIEWNRTDGNLHFTDGNSSKPNIMTNHPMFIFSKYTQKDLLRDGLLTFDDPYDTFYRYVRLDNFTSSHQGKFSWEDTAAALREVFANKMDMVEGAKRPLPINTVYNVILDLNEKSLKVMFYLKNGPFDPETNETTSVFTPYLTFKMNDSTQQ